MFDTRVRIDERHGESTATRDVLILSSSWLLLLDVLPAVHHDTRIERLFVGWREYRFSFYSLQFSLLRVLSFVSSVYSTLEL